MQFRIIILFTVMLITMDCFSQDQKESNVTDVSKVTIINPGVSYEKAIGRNQTLYGQLFMNTSAEFNYSSTLGSSSTFYFDPAVTVQYRYYYNALKRQEKEKRTEMNSLNYLTAVFEAVFSRRPFSTSHPVEDHRRSMNRIGLAWGLQRNYNSRLSFDLNLGPGLLFTKATYIDYRGQTTTSNEGSFTLLGQINLGFWLNRRM